MADIAAMIDSIGKDRGTRRRRGPVDLHGDWWRLIPLFTVVAVAFIGPELVGTSPKVQDLAGRLKPPLGLGGSWEHPLGTDGLGRDLLARIVTGIRLSLIVSVLAALGAAFVGTLAGILAGVRGRIVDRVITMLVETLLAVPFITVGLLVTATIGQSMITLVLLLIFSGWITHARVMRGQVRSLVQADFVLAARAMGGSTWSIAWRHLVPNLLPTAIVVLFQQMGGMLLWSASLTYLGIGMPIERVTLGGIVREGQELIYSAWWVSACGGLAIALMVAGFNLCADWLRGRIDPVQRHAGRTSQV